MTFWKKFQLLGGILALSVAALTLLAAYLLAPDTPPPAPIHRVPPVQPGPGEPTGTTGL